jgi:chromosome segregation ATPase
MTDHLEETFSRLTNQFGEVCRNISSAEQTLQNKDQSLQDLQQKLLAREKDLDKREKDLLKREKAVSEVRTLAASRHTANQVLREQLREYEKKFRAMKVDRDKALNRLKDAKKDPMRLFKE